MNTAKSKLVCASQLCPSGHITGDKSEAKDFPSSDY
jgi:hypothetical protein